ncbi:MAG: YigZ family protein [Nannocystaceae bacterium]|nr:YigZ family protein [Nannocystaceae bacterium]
MAQDDKIPMQLIQRIRVEPDATKGSRFIATAVPATDEDAAKEALAQLRAEMPEATHHCSAWRLATPNLERANDDGEPGGSAGRPILAQLQGRNLLNVAVIVTRYYGGTKLGVGGLVRAYGSAAAAALDAAVTQPYVPKLSLRIVHGYSEDSEVQRALAEFGATELCADYATDVRRRIEVAVDREQALRVVLRDATRGRARVERID